MNIRTKKTTSTVRKRTTGAREAVWGKFDILFFVIILGLGIFAAISLRLTFNSRGVAMSRESEKFRTEIHRLEREIEYLTTRRESLSSWKNIEHRIALFNLPLRLPSPAQTHRMTVNYEKTGLARTTEFAHLTADNTGTDSLRSPMRNVNQ